jgi:AbrB family looped-hinge helix DNA binding protein
MARITSKLQLTLPKALADRYDIRPGDEVHFEPLGSAILLVPMPRGSDLDTNAKLRLFEAARARQEKRTAELGDRPGPVRPFRREELYARD